MFLLLGIGLMLFASIAWPLGLTMLVCVLRWPQLVRPLAVTIVASSLRPLYVLAGWYLGAVWTGRWSDAALRFPWALVDPISVTLPLLSLFLGGLHGSPTGSIASWFPRISDGALCCGPWAVA